MKPKITRWKGWWECVGAAPALLWENAGRRLRSLSVFVKRMGSMNSELLP